MDEMACLQQGAVYTEAIWLTRRTIQRATGAIAFWTDTDTFSAIS